MRIELDLYGPLKALGSRVALDVDTPATAACLKHALAARFDAYAELIAVSAVADDERIYRDADAIGEGRYAVLPPVAGG